MRAIVPPFFSQNGFTTPLNIAGRQREYPLLARLHIITGGVWPPAHKHYTDRPEALTEHIVIFCTGGLGWFRSRGRQWTVRPGDALFVVRGEPHTYGADETNPWSLSYAHFQGSDADMWVRMIGASPAHPVVTIGEVLPINNLFRDMCGAVRRGFTLSAMHYASSCLQHILARMALHQQLPVSERAADLRLESVLKLIQSRIGETLTVQEMAETAQMSPAHFSRAFRAKTGFPPMDFFLRQKIQRACELLNIPAHSISKVGQAVGFANSAYFSRIFRHMTGVSPREYRKARRE